jgi:ABC-type amino acid transport substrate-binding protein
MKLSKKSRRPRTLILAARFLAVLGLSSAGLVQGQTEATPSTPLRVGVSPVFPPMVFEQGKELVGVEIDLARRFAESLGRPVVFVRLPWADQIAALNEGKTDIIMSSMSITPARSHVVRFTRPYFVLGQMALVRREDRGGYVLGFPQPLPGTVGVLKATTGEFLVQREFPRDKRKSYSTSEQAVAALKKEKIDLFISDSTLVSYLAGVHGADGLTNVPMMLSEEPLGWAVRLADEALLKAANEFIERSAKDGSLLKVFREWGATRG